MPRPPSARSGPSSPSEAGAWASPFLAAVEVVSVDRAAHRRTEDGLVATLRADPRTRLLLVHRGRLATDGDGLALVGPDGVADVPEDDATGYGDHEASPRWLFLGEDPASGAGFLALVLPDAADADGLDIEGIDPSSPVTLLVREHEWAGLRQLAGRLDARDHVLATEAVALASWHARHGRCPRCGEPTVLASAGWVRRCVAQSIEHYPRTDPAVIMSVVDSSGPRERLLLGHAAHWPERRFSTLAGYVEPGEGLEDAVRREVHEEVGVVVDDVRYRGSQPWPFPASLMLGFTARAVTTEIRVDGDEVTDARWFTRDELARQAASGEILLPSRASIARALIEGWYGGELPGA